MFGVLYILDVLTPVCCKWNGNTFKTAFVDISFRATRQVTSSRFDSDDAVWQNIVALWDRNPRDTRIIGSRVWFRGELWQALFELNRSAIDDVTHSMTKYCVVLPCIEGNSIQSKETENFKHNGRSLLCQSQRIPRTWTQGTVSLRSQHVNKQKLDISSD